MATTLVRYPTPLERPVLHAVRHGARTAAPAAALEQLALLERTAALTALGELADSGTAAAISATVASYDHRGFTNHTGFGAVKFTQVSMLAHAIVRANVNRVAVDPSAVDAAEGFAEHLWQHRRTSNGLVHIVHPHESGLATSARFDAWGDPSAERDSGLADGTLTDKDGRAGWSDRFVVASAFVNAVTAWSMRDLAHLTGNRSWSERADELADAVDTHLWDDTSGQWNDLVLVGPSSSCDAVTVDGVLGALITARPERARRAVGALVDPDRFAAPFGTMTLARRDSRWQAGTAGRGAASATLDYLAWRAALAADEPQIARRVAAAAVMGAARSRYTADRNARSGDATGATSGAALGALSVAYANHYDPV